MRSSALGIAVVMGLCAPVGPVAAAEEGADKAAALQQLKVVVPGVHAHAGVEPGSAAVLTDLLLEALLERHGVRALGPPDVRSILSAEQQRSLLGCQDEACFAELGGALGADWLVAGNLGKLGALWVLSLQLIDPRRARVTARASARLKSLEQAAEAIGPLVDELLGQQPRQRTPAALAGGGPPPQRQAWSVAEHCRRLRAYFERLEARAYAADVLAGRRALLADLVATQFYKRFYSKTNCFWQHAPGPRSRLRAAWLRSSSRIEAADRLRRIHEADTFKGQIELLEEAVPRHFEMQKLGTGRRLTEVPFAVEAVQLPRPAGGDALEAYQKAEPQARALLARALAAAGPEAFGALFAPRVDERVVRRGWRELQRRREQGFALEPCPAYLYYPAEMEDNARRLRQKRTLRLCLRRAREDFVTRDFVELERDGERWRLVGW